MKEKITCLAIMKRETCQELQASPKRLLKLTVRETPQLHINLSSRDSVAAHLKFLRVLRAYLRRPCYVHQRHLAAACQPDLTAGRSFPRPQRTPPHLRDNNYTTATMSGAVATARPTQALRVRRESQRPGVARVVTKTNNMEDEAAKPQPKLYGMQHSVRACANAQLTYRTVYTQEAYR